MERSDLGPAAARNNGVRLMAYIAFQDFGGIAMPPQGYRAQPVADAAACASDQLTPLEWSVVRIARTDGEGSLRAPGRWSSAFRALFKQPNPMLADARLEALRRMAVLTWRYGYTVPSRDVRAFLGAGFTPGQYETMVDRIGAAVTSRRSSPRPAAR